MNKVVVVLLLLFCVIYTTQGGDVTSPACGEVWYVGKEYTLTFEPAIPVTKIRIELQSATGELLYTVCGSCFSNTPGSYKYDFAPPITEAFNSTIDGFKFAVINSTSNELIASSPCPFSLIHSIFEPNRNSVYYYYQPWRISWNASLYNTEYIQIRFVKGTTTSSGGSHKCLNTGFCEYVYKQPVRSNADPPGYYRLHMQSDSFFPNYANYGELFWIGNNAPYGYVGCYKDPYPTSGKGAGMSLLVFEGIKSIEMCRVTCFQKTVTDFVSIQGNICNCGSVPTMLFNQYGTLPESECNKPCRWNPNEMCGGVNASSVWTSDLLTDALVVLTPAYDNMYSTSSTINVQWQFQKYFVNGNTQIGTLLPELLDYTNNNVVKTFQPITKYNYVEYKRYYTQGLAKYNVPSVSININQSDILVQPGRYYLRVTHNNTEVATSEQFFIFGNSDLEISAPQTDETIQPGSTYEIKWSSMFPELNVDIYARRRSCVTNRGGRSCSYIITTIAKNMPNSGSFVWDVRIAQYSYNIRVAYALENGAFFGQTGLVAIGTPSTSEDEFPPTATSSAVITKSMLIYCVISVILVLCN